MEYNLQTFKAGDILTAAQLNRIEAALKQAMKSALPIKVTCTKNTRKNMPANSVDILVSGLEPGQYVLQLYRQSKSSKDWEMLWDSKEKTSGAGWYYLAGGARVVDKESKECVERFTATIPQWMPHGGVLQTRHAFRISDNLHTTYSHNLDIKTWILDFLKPVDGQWQPLDQMVNVNGTEVPTAVCALIGTAPKKDNSIKFKVGVLKQKANGAFELVGMSDQIIDISGNKVGDACPSHSKIILGTPAGGGDDIFAKNISVRIL